MSNNRQASERIDGTPPGVQRSLRVIAVGDLSFNGDYRRILTERGAKFPFAHVASAWCAADLRVGNLESPITDSARVAPAKFTLRGAPQTAESLGAAGFDIVSLANNHMMDFGPEGIVDTCRRLDAEGIAFVGAGKNLREATSPLILSRNNATIGVLAFCDVRQVSALYATENAPGVAPFNIDAAAAAVRQLRPQVDWLIVHMHWGEEMSQLPSSQQRSHAACLAAAGADLILGHHPHVLQPVEEIDNALVAYSMGDFLFANSYWHGTGGSGRRFLGYYEQHPLSRHTGWLDIMLRNKNPPLAQFHGCRLRRNRQVVPCTDKIFGLLQARFQQLINERRLEVEFASESVAAKVRERWRLSGDRYMTRLRLKLLRLGFLSRVTIEPDIIN